MFCQADSPSSANFCVSDPRPQLRDFRIDSTAIVAPHPFSVRPQIEKDGSPATYSGGGRGRGYQRAMTTMVVAEDGSTKVAMTTAGGRGGNNYGGHGARSNYGGRGGRGGGGTLDMHQ